MSNICIIGTGRQGTAAAYDLLKFSNLDKLLLIDTDQKSINNCLNKIKKVAIDRNVQTLIIDIDNKTDLIKIHNFYELV